MLNILSNNLKIVRILKFIEKEKNKAQENDNFEENLPNITFANLNSMQGFVFKLVEDFQLKNEQLLLIVNREGCKIKKYKIFFYCKTY